MLQETLRGDYCNLPPNSLNLFSQNMSIIIPLMGITSLYFVTASSRSSCSRPQLEALGDPGGVPVDPSRCKAS